MLKEAFPLCVQPSAEIDLENYYNLSKNLSFYLNVLYDNTLHCNSKTK